MMKKITINECPLNLSGIYKIDFPNGKTYIGKAVDIKRRIKEHNTDKRQEVLYLAVTKYFNNNIQEFYILEKCSREELSDRERFWINFYESNNKDKGYNLTSGGDGAALGAENVSAIFNQQDLNNIIHLLQKTSIPMYKIAEEYNCSRATIERLNAGETYFSSTLSYPIRKEKYIPKGGVQNGNSSLTQEMLDQLIEDLLYTSIPMKELCNKYKIAINTMSNINNGRTYVNHDLEYPLRKRNASRAKVFSQEELLLIKTLLEQDKNEVTMNMIGEQLHCDRKIISDINNGKRQHQNDWNYPIRK